MQMRRAFEVKVHTEGVLKIRMVAVAWPGESRSTFNQRAIKLADTVGFALADKYGASKVEFTKR